MGKTAAVKKHFAFVAGLNTEAGYLTFPPNAWSSGDNLYPEVDGSINLRPALDYELSYSLSTTTQTDVQESNGAFTTAEWNGVAGDGNRNYVVVQRASRIEFYVNSGATISTQAKGFTIDLSSYKAPGTPELTGVAPITTANANGKLIIVSRDTEPLLVTYDPDTDTISVEEITVQIRDFIGQDDGLDIEDTPVSLSNEHNYNLLNQGWTTTHINSYKSSTGYYPSNAQSWTAGKDSSDNFTPSLLDKQDFGTSPAPKGRFILSLFNRDRTTVSGVPSLTTETENYRPVTCAFMAGRAWYAGTKSSDIGAWILFSQVAETTSNLGKCYQDADPTSEVVSDLVDSDGGVVPIQDAGNVVALVPYLNSMLVLADNGIWQIVGGSDTGFSASSYEVRRISGIGCVSSHSIVITDSAILFWAGDGIYSIAADQLGSLAVSSITATTIQTEYDAIPITGKIYSSGAFFRTSRIIYWLYNDDVNQNGINQRYKKTRMLCLNTKLGAFYTYTIGELDSLSPYVVDVFVTKTRQSSSSTSQVVDNSSDTVIDGSANNVVALVSGSSASEAQLKFLTIVPVTAATHKVVFSEFNVLDNAPLKHRDWYKNDSTGKTFTGNVVAGYDFGEGQGGDKNFQALYVMVYLKRTETGVDANGDAINPSSCTMQGRWDWTDSAAGNRWSSSQQVYRHTRPWIPAVPDATYDDGHPVVVTKNKVRGKGRAMQLKFSSTADNDMQLLGWAVTYVGNSNV